MRLHLREFLELCARTLVCPEPIVEIGAFQESRAVGDRRSAQSAGEKRIDWIFRSGGFVEIGDYAGVLGMTVVESRW